MKSQRRVKLEGVCVHCPDLGFGLGLDLGLGEDLDRIDLGVGEDESDAGDEDLVSFVVRECDFEGEEAGGGKLEGWLRVDTIVLACIHLNSMARWMRQLAPVISDEDKGWSNWQFEARVVVGVSVRPMNDGGTYALCNQVVCLSSTSATSIAAQTQWRLAW